MVVLLMMASVMQAAVADTAQARRDSLINAEAQRPDFITASLLIASPGTAVYSAFGHAAIRMQSPSNNLDYCFSFGMALDLSSKLDFVLGRAKAGFISQPTAEYLKAYRDEHRSVTAYRLNLTPRQKQELWRVLDNETAKGAAWDYDYPGVNCASMVIYAIYQALLGEQIVYGDLPAVVNGSYRQVLHYISRHDEWARLFWDVALIGKGGETGNMEDKLAPELLVEAWSKASFADSAGHRRPVIVGSPVMLVKGLPPQTGSWFSPWVALALVIVVAIVVAVVWRRAKYKKQNNTAKAGK